ncbi:unnamed protein product [Closterium sp. Naga37s-1]|nr:unnamed protein product [Closterium sp. Naga37s-1]
MKRAICAQAEAHQHLRHEDLSRWCFTRYGIRPDRSTIGKILKEEQRWRRSSERGEGMRVRGGAYPDLEVELKRYVDQTNKSGVPLMLETLRDHAKVAARELGIPREFKCSIGWVRRACARLGIRCYSQAGEAAEQDMTGVNTCRTQLPKLLLYLAVNPRDVVNFDETALYTSALPRKTYGRARVAGRKIPKDRITVAYMCNADGSTMWRPLIISKSKRPVDFRPDFDPEPYVYWRSNKKGWMTSTLFTNYIELLNAAMLAEGREIVVLLDNASSHGLLTETAETEDLFGFRTRKLRNVRLVYLPPNTTCFTQPLDQGIIKAAKMRYRKLWLADLTRQWAADNRRPGLARYKPNMRDVVFWVHDSWMTIGRKTVQRCWWNTGCLPLAWEMQLEYVHVQPWVDPDEDDGDVTPEEVLGGVGALITGLSLGGAALAAEEYVVVDDQVPTCEHGGEDPLAREPPSPPTRAAWEAPPPVRPAAVDDEGSRDTRRAARAACEMLIGYARSINIAPRDMTVLFDIRKPAVIDRLERASPGLNLNEEPLSTASSTPPRSGFRALPWSITGPNRLRELLDSGVTAAMGSFDAPAEWMRGM